MTSTEVSARSDVIRWWVGGSAGSGIQALRVNNLVVILRSCPRDVDAVQRVAAYGEATVLRADDDDYDPFQLAARLFRCGGRVADRAVFLRLAVQRARSRGCGEQAITRLMAAGDREERHTLRLLDMAQKLSGFGMFEDPDPD